MLAEIGLDGEEEAIRLREEEAVRLRGGHGGRRWGIEEGAAVGRGSLVRVRKIYLYS
jgi:hypothetical protein